MCNVNGTPPPISRHISRASTDTAIAAVYQEQELCDHGHGPFLLSVTFPTCMTRIANERPSSSFQQAIAVAPKGSIAILAQRWIDSSG